MYAAAHVTSADAAVTVASRDPDEPSASAPACLDRILVSLVNFPASSTSLVVLGAAGMAWGATTLAGGSRTAFPHLFYIPILLAAVRFGAWGGAATGLLATVLCGPLLALDSVTGQPQAFTNWGIRGAFFVLIGALVGWTATALRRACELALAATLGEEAAVALAAIHRSPVSPELVRDIRAVVEARRFRVAFQPIYSLDTGQVVAVEALTQFDLPGHEAPDVWFARAASVGLGSELELASIDVALQACRDGLSPSIGLNLNASPETICDPRLPALLAGCTDRVLVIEVTEHAVVEDYPRLCAALDVLRSRGIRIAIDDAGAGFASFRHVVRLAPDIIKLDIGLTQDVRQDPVRRALAHALVAFAAETGCELMAEGIEHPADLTIWSQLGASAVQGFLLGRPGPLPVPGSIVPIPCRVGRVTAGAG